MRKEKNFHSMPNLSLVPGMSHSCHYLIHGVDRRSLEKSIIARTHFTHINAILWKICLTRFLVLLIQWPEPQRVCKLKCCLIKTLGTRIKINITRIFILASPKNLKISGYGSRGRQLWTHLILAFSSKCLRALSDLVCFLELTHFL